MAIDKDKVFGLFGRYWEIAYNEGRTGEGFPDIANDVLAELRDALDADGGDVLTADLVEIDGHTYGLRPGAARVVREAMASSDPYLDGTDNAHPAWWRGYDYGFIGAVSGLNRILDGKDDGRGVANEPWQSVRTRLREAMRDAGRYRWLANEMLACDYGDNDQKQVGWIMAEWRHKTNRFIPHDQLRRIFGDSINEAIDAAMAKDGSP